MPEQHATKAGLKTPKRRERLLALYFLLGVVIIGGIWFIPSRHLASVRIAAIGGSLAFFGVILMAIPVLRAGPFQWVANLYFDLQRESGATEAERQQIEDERKFDLVIQQVIGPYLIGIGSLINGISGFF